MTEKCLRLSGKNPIQLVSAILRAFGRDADERNALKSLTRIGTTWNQHKHDDEHFAVLPHERNLTL